MKKIFLLLILTSLYSNSSAQRVYADVNGDGYVTAADVTEVYNVLLGKIPNMIQYDVKGVTFKMIGVTGGVFSMGAENNNEDEMPVHQVTLSSFLIGVTEVTQELWVAVMGSNPSDINGGSLGINLKRPVESVSWEECQIFISKLNEMTGENFRLPTEAEWEFAARGGNKSEGYVYAGSNNINDVAWYFNNAYDVGTSSPDYGTHTVATKAPNELGLYDMSGNVCEWCQDWYGEYSSDEQIDPVGPDTGSSRVYRGGSWRYNADHCRVTDRTGYSPDDSRYNLGLRLAL